MRRKATELAAKQSGAHPESGDVFQPDLFFTESHSFLTTAAMAEKTQAFRPVFRASPTYRGPVAPTHLTGLAAAARRWLGGEHSLALP